MLELLSLCAMNAVASVLSLKREGAQRRTNRPRDTAGRTHGGDRRVDGTRRQTLGVIDV